MTETTLAGMALVIALIAGAGVWSGRGVKNASDFLTGGGKAGKLTTCGAILGTLIGSQATLGTAQLAFNYGLSAWWFTLGSGLGCLALALVYARPLRHSQCVTQFQIIAHEFGRKAESWGSLLCTLGTFVSVLAQVIACTGFIPALFPDVSPLMASLTSIAIVCAYILFGGALGAGLGGILKLLLLYVSCGATMAVALHQSAGLGGLLSALEEVLMGTPLGAIQPEVGLSGIADSGDLAARFLSMTSRGTAKDIGSCLSLVLGILSTQIYVQFLQSARGDREAEWGTLLGLFLVPPIGAAGICVGLFMRGHYITQAEAAALAAAGAAVPDLPVLSGTIQAFPTFALNHMPPFLSGVVLGTLFITIVSGSAGLVLGMSAIVVEDILVPFTHWADTPKKELLDSRLAVLCILIAATVIAYALPAQAINDLGFLSMTLRSAVVLAPLTCALWFPGRVAPRAVLASIVLSPLVAIAGAVLGSPIDPLFLGVGASALCCAAGAAPASLPSSK